MNDPVRVQLQPLGETLEVARGSSLQDPLFAFGVEFPCGGQGRCRGCRVRLLAGTLPVTGDDERMLEPADLAAGWRLACCAEVANDVTLEIAQWETTVLGDETPMEFEPRVGLGIAVDLGTTTVVAQIVDRASGHVLAVRSGLNPQARLGGDVMSRIQYAVTRGGQPRLERLIRREIGRLVRDALECARLDESRLREITDIAIVGNTVMHHLFCGRDLEPLSRYPFEPADDGLAVYGARELGWELHGDPRVRFLPCLGGFVGSDVLAGILATRIHERSALSVLVDLGTNGEVVVGNSERLLCASTAAGPAFEGAGISMGMRAATGAIAGARQAGGTLQWHVLGDVAPRGICGSGLVSAVAMGLERGVIEPCGRLSGGSSSWTLCQPVALTQGDIRHLQLAKGAIAAGVRILLDRLGATADDVAEVHLAGAFGNYVDHTAARRIGLIAFPGHKLRAAGNTALLGAKVALFTDDGAEAAARAIRGRTEHLGLSSDPRFQEIFVEEMGFPAPGEREGS